MAIGFSASGDVASRAANTPLRLTSTWTICGWAKITSVRASEYQYFIGCDNDSDKYELIGYNSSGNLELPGVLHQEAGLFPSSPNVGEWFYVAIVQSGTGANNLKGYFKHPSGSWVSVTIGVGQGTDAGHIIHLGNDGFDEYCNVHWPMCGSLAAQHYPLPN